MKIATHCEMLFVYNLSLCSIAPPIILNTNKEYFLFVWFVGSRAWIFQNL